MNLEHLINRIVILFIYFIFFNGPIRNSDYVVSDWIIVNIELERIWKNVS
jgi:hypothetical protein